jgi:hypothetical protein
MCVLKSMNMKASWVHKQEKNTHKRTKYTTYKTAHCGWEPQSWNSDSVAWQFYHLLYMFSWVFPWPDRGFRNIGKTQSDAREIPKRTYTRA